MFNMLSHCDANAQKFFPFFITGKFTNVVAKWPGSTHDSHIFRTSSVAQDLAGTHLENGVLLGDRGYACMPFLMTPYLEPETQSQRRFNRAHRVTRSLIERTFGVLKRRFYVLHGQVRMCPERVCVIVVACCVLHNIAIDYNEPLHEEEEEPLVEENINIPYNGVNTGAAVRNHIAATYF
jgi:hypothetical protein